MKVARLGEAVDGVHHDSKIGHPSMPVRGRRTLPGIARVMSMWHCAFTARRFVRSSGSPTARQRGLRVLDDVIDLGCGTQSELAAHAFRALAQAKVALQDEQSKTAPPAAIAPHRG